jgi:hypothetical protein
LMSCHRQANADSSPPWARSRTLPNSLPITFRSIGGIGPPRCRSAAPSADRQRQQTERPMLGQVQSRWLAMAATGAASTDTGS